MQLIPVPLFVNQEARLHCQADSDCFHYLSFPDSLNGAFYLISLSPYPSLVTAFFIFLSPSLLSNPSPQNLDVLFSLVCLVFSPLRIFFSFKVKTS